MNPIVPHLWYDKEAKEAAQFYTRVFGTAGTLETTLLNDTPDGDVEAVEFSLAGLLFRGISAGPYFKFNPSLSLIVNSADTAETDRLFAALSGGGQILMPLDEYPFSKRYAWFSDRYGLSWQLFTSPGAPIAQRITPSLMFSGANCGKAQDAIAFYTGVFKDSRAGNVLTYPEGMAASPLAKVQYAEFTLNGTTFSIMDNAFGEGDAFNEAISLMVGCDTQEEIDYYWEKLSAVPEAEQCGWLKDKYGVSWQIVPSMLQELMSGTPEESGRVVQAFLKMKKFDIAALIAARNSME
jgi:predicted 3-demethylubiquinone-9 3-methyltransferase (glyoxalase superfamily)